MLPTDGRRWLAACSSSRSRKQLTVTRESVCARDHGAWMGVCLCMFIRVSVFTSMCMRGGYACGYVSVSLYVHVCVCVHVCVSLYLAWAQWSGGSRFLAAFPVQRPRPACRADGWVRSAL